MKFISRKPRAGEMSLMEHLEELRGRLVKVMLAFAICSVGAWFVYEPTLALLIRPLKRLPEAELIVSGGNLIVTAPTEAFVIRLKVVAFTGFVFALPIILWQIWRFVTPGLYSKEKRYVIPFVFVSILLFLAGISLAFFSLPKALEVLASFTGNDLTLVPRASEYLSFVLLLIAAFGFAFEFPIVLLALTMVGVLSTQSLRKGRRTAWLVILIVSAVITPTQDPLTLFMMAIPLAFLYEGTILTARLMKK